MKKWLRRIRGAVGMGLTWAVAWSGVGVILGLVVGGAPDVAYSVFFAVYGFLAGATFSGVLGMAGRRSRFDQMSLPRFAAWGALAGLLLSALSVFVLSTEPMFVLANVVFLSVVTLLAAGSAAGSLALAGNAVGRSLADEEGNRS